LQSATPDGPVRGNGKIHPEWRQRFKGAGLECDQVIGVRLGQIIGRDKTGLL